jgi:hypothetical protein
MGIKERSKREGGADYFATSIRRLRPCSLVLPMRSIAMSTKSFCTSTKLTGLGHLLPAGIEDSLCRLSLIQSFPISLVRSNRCRRVPRCFQIIGLRWRPWKRAETKLPPRMPRAARACARDGGRAAENTPGCAAMRLCCPASKIRSLAVSRDPARRRARAPDSERVPISPP